ncbi:hypothetical protein ACIO02_25720, partial [Streptomyces sp. NPDC087568]
MTYPTSLTHARLLPWSGPEGKPAVLLTDNTASPLALLADSIEDQQVTPPTRKRAGFLRRWLSRRAEDQPGPVEDVRR